MKSKIVFLAALVGLFWITGCQKEDPMLFNEPEEEVFLQQQNGDIIPGQYVVVLAEGTLKSTAFEMASYQEKKAMVTEHAGALLASLSVKEYEFGHIYAASIRGFSIKMSEENAATLAGSIGVKTVEPDRVVTLSPPSQAKKPGSEPDPPLPEQVPYGIARVGSGSGVGKTAWIIDTGIDLDHPDLNVDASRAAFFVSRVSSADDDNGHGTHCAGIVAALENDIGVIGVAAGATVVPVKVLDKRGRGAMSEIISGVEYVAAYASAGDAANMSLGGSAYDALDDAVYAASQKGIYFSLAAGNESDDANNHSPARVNGPNIFTVSAMGSGDQWAYFSNYGNPPVDFCEPGVSIYSTYKNGGYATMSGTSMAAPHMCGILLMTNGNPNTDGTVNGDPDGDPDSIGVIY